MMPSASFFICRNKLPARSQLLRGFASTPTLSFSGSKLIIGTGNDAVGIERS